MKTPQDIIEIVKELQDFMETGKKVSRTEKTVQCREVPESLYLFWQHVTKHFPAIAEALQIAVEALDFYESEYDNGINTTADIALQKIRSLQTP